jgi:hypothetical protein
MKFEIWLFSLCIVSFFAGLLCGLGFWWWVDATQTEFFHKDSCVLFVKGSNQSWQGDLDCKDFFNARSADTGKQYCAEQAKGIIQRNTFTPPMPEYDFDCTHTCCMVDGSCYGCQAMHQCYCTATIKNIKVVV